MMRVPSYLMTAKVKAIFVFYAGLLNLIGGYVNKPSSSRLVAFERQLRGYLFIF